MQDFREKLLPDGSIFFFGGGGFTDENISTKSTPKHV